MRALFIIVPILIAVSFVFVIASIISPKIRGKMLSRQVKAMKYMVDESKDDLEDISTNMADASKEGIRITANAMKRGFTEESMFCKYCGCSIDADSRFCKKCGYEQ